MFLLEKDIKKLEKKFVIVQGLSSLNGQNISSSNGVSEEAMAFLVAGHEDEVPNIYAAIIFDGFNDIYISDEIIIGPNDIKKVWQEGIDFLEDMGFLLDELDEVSLKETQLFNLQSNSLKGKETGLSKENYENIIDYLSSF